MADDFNMQWLYNPLGAAVNSLFPQAPPKPPGSPPTTAEAAIKPWSPSESDPYGIEFANQPRSPIPGGYTTGIKGRALKDAKDNALTALGESRSHLAKFGQDNDDMLRRAKADWTRTISEYKDLSAQSAQQQLQGMDAQFETNSTAWKAQAEQMGIPRDQIEGTINQQRMQTHFAKGTLLAEASAKVNENRLEAEKSFYKSYYSLESESLAGEAQLGQQLDLTSAEIEKWWAAAWSDTLTQAELMEQQADLAEVSV